MKKPESITHTVDTRYGEAGYYISPEGELRLYWKNHVFINGVGYYAVSVTQKPNYVEVSGYPTDLKRSGLTDAAQRSLKSEHERLHQQLVTPAAIRASQEQLWLTREYAAWEAVQQARRALDGAIATLEERRKERREGMGLTDDDRRPPSLDELLSAAGGWS